MFDVICQGDDSCMFGVNTRNTLTRVNMDTSKPRTAVSADFVIVTDIITSLVSKALEVTLHIAKENVSKKYTVLINVNKNKNKITAKVNAAGPGGTESSVDLLRKDGCCTVARVISKFLIKQRHPLP